MKKEQIILGAAVALAVVLVVKKSGIIGKLQTAQAMRSLPSLDTGRGYDAADPGRYMSVADLMDASTGVSYDDIPTFSQTVDAVIGTYDRETKYGPRIWTPF